MNRAHTAATVATLTDVDPSTITQGGTYGHLSLWSATTVDGRTVVAVLPALRACAPARWQRVYLGRVEANLTGRCPACQAVLDTTGHTEHANRCPVVDPRLSRWLEVAA